jgi:endonuclease YncB( thermonuclease family)
MKRSPASSKLIPFLILVAAVFLWLRDQQPSTKPSPPKNSGGAFERYDSCRLIDSRGNDGDSFLVRLPDGREEIFRLYYVDAPESAFKTYHNSENNHARIADQANDLGGISPEQAVEIGRRAKKLTHQILNRGFTLHTRWDSPFRDERYHAFVELDGTPRWLHERLVAKGLARIHTKPDELPDGTAVGQQLARLRELEQSAKSRGEGAWSFLVR